MAQILEPPVRIRAAEQRWRRRESNPRPQPHRLSVYKRRLPFRFARRPGCSRPTAGLADPSVSRFGRSALPPRRARSLAPPPSHGQSRGGVATLGLPRQRVRDRSSHLRFAGGFTRPTGDLGLQLIRMDRPRRSQVAPVCCVGIVAVPMFHVILRQSGPKFDPARPLEEQTGWDDHAAFMDSLVEQGHIVLARAAARCAARQRPRRSRLRRGLGGRGPRDLGARPVARVAPRPRERRALGHPARRPRARLARRLVGRG